MLLLLVLYGGNLFCFMQQAPYCSVSETAPDTQCVRSWADSIANVDSGKERNLWEKYFPFSGSCSMVTIQIVPGIHLVAFIRIVEKDNVYY